MFACFGMAGYMVIAKSQVDQRLLYKVITAVITGIELTAYRVTALKNPGILSSTDPIPEDFEFTDYGNTYCCICRIYKDATIEHCIDCDVCIDGYDHHCPWTGKCIGKGNQIPFFFFLGWTPFFIFYCFVVSLLCST